MKNKSAFIFLSLAMFFFTEGIKADKDKLPPRYQKWLDEEVIYIITPMEKEVFLQLKTDRERDLFIEAFWKHRDPTPSNEENEFKNEHYRRINYANHFFGRGSPIAGWRTDRGRVYILLGEPNDIQRLEGKSATYPSEIWFYQGKVELGLPPGFNLVFFQQGGVGDYKLYSPLRDGPQALMTSYYGDPVDYLSAYQQLREYEPTLADVSLSLIPGEESASLGRPSLSSDLLLQRVEMAPLRQVEERYAQKFLQYKDIVEVEYTANYINSDSQVKVIKEPSGMYFVHYALEPERLSVNLYENKYYTTLKVNATVRDSAGKIIFQFEKSIPLDFDEEKMRGVSRQPMNILDMFPLIPGNYKLSILVKNEASKEFTSVEKNIIIPQEEGLQMSSLLLGYKVIKVEPKSNKLKPFQLGSRQVYSQPNRVFVKGDTLFVAFQIHGLSQDFKQNGEVKFVFLREGQEFRTTSYKIAQFSDLPNFVEAFPLMDFLPAHYRIQVSLLAEGREVLSESEEFDVTHLEAIPRPWFHSKILPESEDPVYAYLIGTQLFNSGKIEEARDNLERAYQGKPDSVDFAMNLARVYMAMADYKKIESILLPFLNQEKPAEYELYFLLGRAYKNMGELAKAVEIFEKAISHYGLNVNILNIIGECYFQLGRTSEARVVWEKSLEINPDQPQIRKNVDSLKEKK